MRAWALAMVAAASGTALGQGVPGLAGRDGRDDLKIVEVQVGFRGAYAPERWTPMRVLLESGPRAFSGRLVLTYRQDGTQGARIMVPAATTPGVQTWSDIVFAPAFFFNEFRLVFENEVGRKEAEAAFNPTDSVRSRIMPEMYEVTEGLVVSCGVASLGSAIRDDTRVPDMPVGQESTGVHEPSLIGPALTARRWDLLRMVPVPPSDLPRDAMAYDGVALLVVAGDPGEGADARAMEAVREWVVGGGRLAVLLDAGGRWRQWLPEGEAGAVADAGPVGAVATPVDLAELVRAAGSEAGGSVRGRVITPTAPALRDGWTTDWRADGSPGADNGGGLLAQGPVGFGWVALIGLDPRSAPASASSGAERALWRAALETSLHGHLARALDDQPRYQSSSGASPRESAAIAAVLDEITPVPAIGDGAFIGVGACVLLLAIMVGPGDALILRRLRLRHRSWLTALAWTGLAAAAAYALPAAIHRGGSVLARFRAIDAIADADTAPLVRTTGLSGYFSAAPRALRLEGAEGGAWWRGVSSVQMNQWGSDRRVLSEFSTAQRQAGGGGRGNTPLPARAPQWTFRTMMDRGGGECPVRARVRREGEGYRVEISGVPPEAEVRSATLRNTAGWWTLARNPEGSGQDWITDAAPSAESAAWTPHDVPAAPQYWEESPTYGVGGAATLNGFLPGAWERTAAIEARLAGGGWAALYLDIRGLPSDVHQPGAGESTLTFVRLLVLEEGQE